MGASIMHPDFMLLVLTPSRTITRQYEPLCIDVLCRALLYVCAGHVPLRTCNPLGELNPLRAELKHKVLFLCAGLCVPGGHCATACSSDAPCYCGAKAEGTLQHAGSPV